MKYGAYPRVLRVYVRLVAASLQARMEYKFNFILTTLLYGLLSVVDILLLATILTRFRSVGGWTLYEVALLYGLSSTATGLYRTLTSEINRFEQYIIHGDFDGLLLRPWPSLFVLLTRSVDIWRIGWAIQGIAITLIAGTALIRTGELHPLSMVYLGLLPIAGAAIFFAVGLVTAALGFWVERIEELQVFTMYAPQNASCYPLDIYPPWLRWLFSSAIPVAFVNYVPVRYLLGKGGGWYGLLLSPVVAAVAVFLAHRFWRLGESRYQSTGS